MINVNLWKFVYVIFEILLYYTWIRSFLMFNVNLPSSDFCRLTIVKWCRRAVWGCLRRREFWGLAWGFLIFFFFFWEFFLFIFFVGFIWRPCCFVLMFSEIGLWGWNLDMIFGDCCLFRCKTLMKNVICTFWV